jgi:hypothetical protein
MMLMSDALAASQLGVPAARSAALARAESASTSRHADESGKWSSSNLPTHAQRFLSSHDQINNLFRLRSYGLSAARAPPLPHR